MTALDEHLAAYADPVRTASSSRRRRAASFAWRTSAGACGNPRVAAAGVGPLRVHDMRHTCASLAIAEGADIKVLQRMLGHASAALTLDRYGHLFPGQAQSVAERLDEKARLATPADSPAGFSRDRRSRRSRR